MFGEFFCLKCFSTKLLQKQPLYNLFGGSIQVTKNVPGIFYNVESFFKFNIFKLKQFGKQNFIKFSQIM